MREVDEVETPTTSSASGEAKPFTMATTGWVFTTVMGGLYSNKVESVIREIVSNAIDANILAGNSAAPVNVTLPTAFKSIFSVRDYGAGMEHDFVMELYSCVGESTKRGTNFATGMFGLGSKSPFAICDGFTVTTFVDGTKRVYSTFYNTDGIPVIKLQATVATDEANGTLVSMAVRQDDIHKFETALRKLVFAYYDKNVEFNRYLRADESDPMDIVKRSVCEFVPGLFQLLPSAADKSHNPWNGKVFIRQGTALYPLETSELNIISYASDYERTLRMLQKNGAVLLFDMPIGSFDVTPSRESISYNQKSVSNITAHVSATLDAAIEKIAGAVGDAKTVREAFTNVISTYPADMQQRPSAWAAAEDIVRFAARNLAGTIKQTLHADILLTDDGKTPAIKGYVYAGQVSCSHYGGLPVGYFSRADRVEIRLPCVAMVIPSSVRHWEDRVANYLFASSGFNIIDADKLFAVVVRCKQADVEVVAERLNKSDMFVAVFSDASQLPPITKEMEASAPLPKTKYGRDEVFVWEDGDWSDAKRKVDFAVPAYYVTRVGISSSLSLGDIVQRKAFKDAGYWKGLNGDTYYSGLILRDAFSGRNLSGTLRAASELGLIQKTLPVYRLTESQAQRLHSTEHAMVDVLSLIRDGVVARLADYEEAVMWANFPGITNGNMQSSLITTLYRMMTDNFVNAQEQELALLLLSDDTFAAHLIGCMRRAAHTSLGDAVGIPVSSSSVSLFNSIMRDLFINPRAPDCKHDFAALEDTFEARFSLLNHVRAVDYRHAILYVNAVLASDDDDITVIDLTKFPQLAADIVTLRAAVNAKLTQKEQAA